MARNKPILADIREKVIAVVEQFNVENKLPVEPAVPAVLRKFLHQYDGSQEEKQPVPGDYVPRFKKKFLYLDRAGLRGRLSEICRLTWTGDMNSWEFAIYKHSTNRYDPDEWFFPGAEEVDGTIEGAMRAGLAAYPD